MKTVKFRPLRRIKKTGKITVASYMEWNRLRCADYSKFILIVNDEYKKLPKSEFVYNHKGELLYFFDYNPADVPIYDSVVERIFDENWLDRVHANKKPFGIRWSDSTKASYRMDGADCVGTPTFSFFTQEYISDYFCSSVGGYPERIFDFNPLTVGTVVKWLGWFLWQLQNSRLNVR